MTLDPDQPHIMTCLRVTYSYKNLFWIFPNFWRDLKDPPMYIRGIDLFSQDDDDGDVDEN